MTVTQVIHRYLRRMRAWERHEPSPEVTAITGLVPPDIDAEAEYRRHEDAVVAATAETARCTALITRNIRDFAGAPMRVFTPQEYLSRNDEQQGAGESADGGE